MLLQNIEIENNISISNNYDDIAATSYNPALIFQGINYNNQELNNIKNNLNIGAIYLPEDGKTYLYIRLNDVSGENSEESLIQTIYLNKNNNAELIINWGDDSEEVITSSGNFNCQHTYGEFKDYIITIWISNGTGTYSFGNENEASSIFGVDQNKKNSLIALFIGIDVVTIKDYAFQGCGSLKEMTIPNNVISIGQYAFRYCYSLVNIILPTGFATIGTSAFQNCYSLANLSLGNTTTSISGYAFQNCYSLLNAILPDSISSLGSSVFSNCYNLKKIIISKLLTNLPTYAFTNEYSLTSIVVPSNIATINSWVFQNCYAMKEYIFLRSTPPTLSNINSFSNLNTSVKIYVPDASVANYQSANNWSNYSSYIYPLSQKKD